MFCNLNAHVFSPRLAIMDIMCKLHVAGYELDDDEPLEVIDDVVVQSVPGSGEKYYLSIATRRLKTHECKYEGGWNPGLEGAKSLAMELECETLKQLARDMEFWSKIGMLHVSVRNDTADYTI
jgi:hypothetical protein